MKAAPATTSPNSRFSSLIPSFVGSGQSPSSPSRRSSVIYTALPEDHSLSSYHSSQEPGFRSSDAQSLLLSPRKPIMMSNQAPQRSLLKPICYVLLLLAIDAAISLGLVSSMVSFLHGHGNGPFEVEYPKGSGFLLAGHPAGLVVNQGHTTNAAGGTALVLVGFGGVIALFLERRSRMKYGKSAWEFELWAFVSILSCLLTLGALIYTFVETRITSEQLIDPEIASQYPFPNRYPDDRWAPENWYGAMLALPISTADENEIIRNIRLMRGWRWNIIPLFLLGFTLAVLASLEVRRTKNSLARSDYPMKQMS